MWLFAACYAYSGLNRGWVPHDEGQFAQTAARVLAGEMPHRDFDEMYTGGLSYVNAAAFRILGEDLRSLRLVLFGFFLLWVPAVFYVASRSGSELVAGAVTVLAVVWSIPTYPSPVPSWYNLFFAVFGVAAVLRHLETGHQRWLFVAGLCGGLSFLVKFTGVYFVLGVLLFFIFREQSTAWAGPDSQEQRSRLYGRLVSVGLLAFVGFLSHAMIPGSNVARLIALLAPTAGVCLILVWRERLDPPAGDAARFRTLVRMAVPFVVGVAVPIALYLVPVAIGGGLGALYREVDVLPQRRLTYASYAMPPFNLDATAPVLALMWCVLTARRELQGRVPLIVISAILSVAFIASRPSLVAYQVGWRPVLSMTAFAVLAWGWLFRDANRSPDVRHQPLMLLIFVTTMCGLVQFPYSFPVYFCYVAPLVALTLAALFNAKGQEGHPLAAALLVFYAFFAVFRVTSGSLYPLGKFYVPDELTARLAIPRAGALRVRPPDADIYGRLVALVVKHARNGVVYAAPDCPEVYFLSGLSNPTRTIYEFLSDPKPAAETLSLLTVRQVTTVVINTTPEFSQPLSSDLQSALRARFPLTQSVGSFEVRWRE